MWAHLAVRGIRFFESLWRINTDRSDDVRLRWELPKLECIGLIEPPYPVLDDHGSQTETMLLKKSIEGTKELQMALALTQGLTTPDPAGTIRSSILAGASSLQCLRLTCFYLGWDSLELPYTAIGLLNDVLLDLTELKVLSLWTRMVFYDELVVLGSRIRSHPRLRRLILWGINIAKDEGDLNKHIDSLMCY